MHILKDLQCEIEDTNSYHWDFDSFHDEASSLVLSLGYNSYSQRSVRPPFPRDIKWALFNNWAPCEYAQIPVIENLNAIDAEKKFDNVLSICRYTARWLNQNTKAPKHIYCFYPYSDKIVPAGQEKEFDVIYHGGIHGREHKHALKVMRKFKYAFSSLSYGINRATKNSLKFATHRDLAFQEKINLVARSKISICFNLIHVSVDHLKNYRRYDASYDSKLDLIQNLSLSGVLANYPWVGVLPQFKTRIHEAAVSKTLNLVFKDPWNVIEDYYEPGVDFIYFDSLSDLEDKINHVLKNWHTQEIQGVVNSAFEKSKRFTTENFVRGYGKILGSNNPILEPQFNNPKFWDLLCS